MATPPLRPHDVGLEEEMMALFLEILKTKPHAVAMFALLFVSISPIKREPSVVRGLLYLFAYLISAYLLLADLLTKESTYSASLMLLFVLGYQLRILKKLRGDETPSDLDVFKNVQRIWPKAPEWLNWAVPALGIFIIAVLSYVIIINLA